MQLFAQMTKVNVAERTVEGIIANECKDLSGEIFDYDSSKPYFEKWSEGVAKATAGKSLGNVRVMHGNAVAGTTKEITFNDDSKDIYVKAYIADDNEWNKTLAGCYTGFSIGGKYVNKWDAPDGKRFTANPTEYSIVDLPCNPEAQFTVIKAEGAEEMRKFAPAPFDLQKALDLAHDYESNEMAALTKVHEGIQAARAADPLLVEKSLWTVGRLADLLQSLKWLCEDAAYEDDRSFTELKSSLEALGRALIRMTQDSVSQLTDGEVVLALSAQAALQKINQVKEDAMSNDLQKKHDDAVAALATATENLAKANSEKSELQKALDTASTQLAEQGDLLTKAAERITALDATIKEQGALLEKFNNAPQPVRIALTAIAKSADSVNGDSATVEPVLEPDGTVNKAATAIKQALLNPVVTR